LQRDADIPGKNWPDRAALGKVSIGSKPEMVVASTLSLLRSRQRTQQRTSPIDRFGPKGDINIARSHLFGRLA
jgi:hypothetical protein